MYEILKMTFSNKLCKLISYLKLSLKNYLSTNFLQKYKTL